MNRTAKAYLSGIVVILALCYASYLVGQWKSNNHGAVVLTTSHAEADQEYNCKEPLKVYDKGRLKHDDIIPSSVEKDRSKIVTATGTIQNGDGTTHVSSVLDEQSGKSVIIKERPFSEFMSAQEIGIGYTIGSIGSGLSGRYRYTAGRLWGLYAEAQLEAWNWKSGQRLDEGHSIDGQLSAFITYRFP